MYTYNKPPKKRGGLVDFSGSSGGPCPEVRSTSREGSHGPENLSPTSALR